MMIYKGIAAFGLLALAVFASPMTGENLSCEGWFDAAAGVCDTIGD